MTVPMILECSCPTPIVVWMYETVVRFQHGLNPEHSVVIPEQEAPGLEDGDPWPKMREGFAPLASWLDAIHRRERPAIQMSLNDGEIIGYAYSVEIR